MIPDQSFGNSEAAINLATMLNEIDDPKITAKVQTFFMHHFYMVNTVRKDIKDPKVKRYLFNLIRRGIKVELDVPEIIRTHMENVFIAKARTLLGA